MSDEVQIVTLIVNLGDDVLPDEVNEATTQLYRELLTSEADRVEKVRRSDQFQPGTKGDPLTIGAIALALGAAAAPGVVEIVKSWISRRHLDSGSSVTIKLSDGEITFPVAASATPDELEALTDRFVALLKKHGSEGGLEPA